MLLTVATMADRLARLCASCESCDATDPTRPPATVATCAVYWYSASRAPTIPSTRDPNAATIDPTRSARAWTPVRAQLSISDTRPPIAFATTPATYPPTTGSFDSSATRGFW